MADGAASVLVGATPAVAGTDRAPMIPAASPSAPAARSFFDVGFVMKPSFVGSNGRATHSVDGIAGTFAMAESWSGDPFFIVFNREARV